jgi:hypothetical protein
MTWPEQPLQYMAFNPQRHTVVRVNFFNQVQEERKGGGGIHLNNRENNRSLNIIMSREVYVV